MAKQDYVPAQNSKKVPWATNLKTTIAADGPTIGLSGGEVMDVQTASQEIIDGVNEIEAAITAKEAVVDAATVKIRNAEKVIRANIKRGKTHPSYTNAIGQHLGVVGDDQSIDVPNSKPVISVKKIGGAWTIEFNLHGYFDGVNIYKMSPPDDAAFSFLALDTSSPYVDNAAVTNGTRYYAYFVLNGMQAGLQSNEVTVSV